MRIDPRESPCTAACGSREVVAPIPPYPPAWPSLTDQDDYPIWAAAKVAGAGYVVSENTRDFPPRRQDGRHVHDGIEYLPAAVFLRKLGLNNL